MAQHNFNISFSALSVDNFLRNDEKYHNFIHTTGWNLFNIKNVDLIPLKDILIEEYQNFTYQDDESYKGIPTGQSYISADGNLIDWQEVTLDNHPNRLKYAVTNQNILISSLRLAKSPALLFETEDLTNYVFSNGFYIFKVKENWNIKFILWILRSQRLKYVLDNNLYRGIGISAYKQDDLLKIKIPFISKAKQDLIAKKIEPLEFDIKNLNKQIKPQQEIINQVFTNTFNFDYKTFEKLKTIKNYNLNFSEFASNIDIRQSVKFHREAADFVLAELKKHTTKKIKHFISEPIVLGKGISPSEYDDDGDFVYIAMSNIKNWQFEIDEARSVSNTFSNKNSNKQVTVNDILMARSGEGTIGKVALIEDEDLQGIFADFTMRIRLKNYNPRFAYYYFRTTYFQYLIEINKKGLGNNTNIFPSQIQEFPLIDISLEEQQVIVDEIQSTLNKQNVHKLALEAKRLEIDQIIQTSIR